MKIKRKVRKCYRPSSVVPQTQKKKKVKVGVNELQRRFANGLDLWTGLPLKDEEAIESIKLRYS